MSKRALVTGGAGFIGSHLVERLVGEGWGVRVLDNFSTGSLQHLAGVRDEVEILTGDVRDSEVCASACRDADTVFHLAAIASVPASVADPTTSHAVTMTGTLNVLMAARDENVRRVVFSSSAAVYGDAAQVPTAEDSPLHPQSPYAIAKAGGELYCRNFWELYGLETVALRYFNVFGPRQSPFSGYAAAIPKFVHAALNRARPVVFGDGLQTRDFVYVANVVQANLLAAEEPTAVGEALNIGGGFGITLLRLLAELEQLAGCSLAPEFHPGRAGEVRHSTADISRARRLLRYEPSVSLPAGLQLTLAASGRAQVEEEPAALAAAA